MPDLAAHWRHRNGQKSGDQERIETWFAVAEPILNAMLADPDRPGVVGVFAWWLDYQTGLVKPTPAKTDPSTRRLNWRFVPAS